LVGYICETNTFTCNIQVAEITESDILCFKNAGAYCMTMASNYNSRLLSAETLLINDEPKLIRKRQNFDYLLENQILTDL
jgi:diaminopimelate decarboxylase